MNQDKTLENINTLLKSGKMKEAWEMANKITDIKIYEKLGYTFKQYAQWGNAINFFNRVLKHQPNNKTIKHEKAFLTEILKQEQLDIFASTNLNKDPWLE